MCRKKLFVKRKSAHHFPLSTSALTLAQGTVKLVWRKQPTTQPANISLHNIVAYVVPYYTQDC